MILLSMLLACGDDPVDTAAESSCPTTSGTICVYAGTGQAGYDPEIKHRLDTMLYFPMDMEIEEGKPTILIDWNNNSIRQVTSEETVELAIGTGYAGDGPPDYSDKTPGGSQGTVTALNHPTDIEWMADGQLLITVWHNHKMRTWDPETGLVHVIAGDGAGFSGDGGDAFSALFSQPHGGVSAPDGTIYITDMRNGRIRVIGTDNVINTLGGDGTQGYGGDGGPVSEAIFNFPTGATPRPGGSLALDGNTLYVSDMQNHRIRAIDLTTGIIDTIAGTGVAGDSGDDGSALQAQLNNPVDIEIGDGKLYVADTDNSRVRVIDLSTGIISAFAGTGETTWSGDGGPALDAALNYPYGIDLTEDGRVFIADTYNHVIRVVYP